MAIGLYAPTGCEENGDAAWAKWVRVGVILHYPICHALGCETPWQCDHSELNPGREIGGSVWVWHRGFVCMVACETDWWLANGAATVASQPVRNVRLTDRRPYCDGESNPHWSCEPTFELESCWLPDESVLLAGGICRKQGRELQDQQRCCGGAVASMSPSCARREEVNETGRRRKATPAVCLSRCHPHCYRPRKGAGNPSLHPAAVLRRSHPRWAFVDQRPEVVILREPCLLAQGAFVH